MKISELDVAKPSSTNLGFRLPLHLKQMGAPETCGHRSGWAYVMEHLKKMHDPNGIVLDDFVERTFQHRGMRHCWEEPWVGIFHHPPNLPYWFDESAPPQVITNLAEFRQSLPWLKGAIALSEHLGDWLSSNLRVPTFVIKHPTEVPSLMFSMERFTSSAPKTLIQVGWYARNYRGIYQVPVPADFRKVHLTQEREWVLDAMHRTDKMAPQRFRPDVGYVEKIPRVDNDQYDHLLSSSIIFCEYLDVSASNTVIEAIARNTPIVVNRLPANIEYLGSDYPLYYNDIEDVKALLGDLARIADAFQILREMKKDWISVDRFCSGITEFVRNVTVD